MIIRKDDNMVRSADKDTVRLKRKGNTYVKHVTREYDVIKEIYNNKGELKGIDVVKRSPDEVEAIYNQDEGTVIVLIKDNKNRKFKGVAKCMKEDDFDPTRGYSIALSKAKIKQEEARIKILSK